MQLHKVIGETLHYKKSYPQAISSYTTAVNLATLKPGQTQLLNELHYLTGLAFKQQGNYFQALDMF